MQNRIIIQQKTLNKSFILLIQMVRIFLRIEYWKNRSVMRFCMNLMEFTH